MGSAAKAAHAARGEVLGVMPEFLRNQEAIYDEVETVVVSTMHERKRMMFEQSDAFAVLPGGIGTIEELVELISWRRLGLHHKPIVFLDIEGFWRPFFALVEHTVAQGVTPAWLSSTWGVAERTSELLPIIRDMLEESRPHPEDAGEVAAKA